MKLHGHGSTCYTCTTCFGILRLTLMKGQVQLKLFLPQAQPMLATVAVVGAVVVNVMYIYCVRTSSMHVKVKLFFVLHTTKNAPEMEQDPTKNNIIEHKPHTNTIIPWP